MKQPMAETTTSFVYMWKFLGNSPAFRSKPTRRCYSVDLKDPRNTLRAGSGVVDRNRAALDLQGRCGSVHIPGAAEWPNERPLLLEYYIRAALPEVAVYPLENVAKISEHSEPHVWMWPNKMDRVICTLFTCSTHRPGGAGSFSSTQVPVGRVGRTRPLLQATAGQVPLTQRFTHAGQVVLSCWFSAMDARSKAEDNGASGRVARGAGAIIARECASHGESSHMRHR